MSKPTCSFFAKTNACKHGDECIKTHRTQESNCIVLKNLYLSPYIDLKSTLSPLETEIHTEIFYEDLFISLSLEFGEIICFFIAQNTCRHIVGNVYVQFKNKESTELALAGLSNRTYYFSKIKVERGAMSNISEGICEDFIRRSCSKGGDCSYVHPLNVSKRLVDELFLSQQLFYNPNKKIR